MTELLHPTLVYFVWKDCSPSWKLDNARLTKYALTFILEGSAEYEVDGRTFHVKKGDVVFLSINSSRKASTEGMSCVALDFVLGPGEEIRLPVVFSPEDFQEYLWYFHEINYEWLQQDPAGNMRSQALFLLALHRLLYRSGHEQGNPHVEKIKRYIVEHFNEKLTVQSLAEIARINPVYCGALFKKQEGCTVSEYINRVRINKAASLLGTGEYTVSEAAYKTGFSDIYHFSNCFKRFVGMSPSAYRSTPFFPSQIFPGGSAYPD
mgnify:FL=1